MLIYLIYLTFSWGLFALLYFAFFRKETFFTLNRFYLLGALGAGLVLPLLAPLFTGADGFAKTTADVIYLPEIVVSIQSVAAHGTAWETGLLGIWLAGVLWMSLRFFWGLRTLMLLVRNAERREIKDKYCLVFSEKAILPFSFFKWIFIAAGSEEDKELTTMIAHEKVHAGGWHTVDILFCELLCILFWWNPLVYWYKNAVRTVHEYIADEETANQFSRKQYGLLLIRHAQSGPALALANHFFQSPLKQRLVMLTKNASAPVCKLKYALIIPVITLLFICVPQPELPAQSPDDNHTEDAMKVENNNDTAIAPANEKSAEYPGGMQALGKYLSENLKYPTAAKKAKAEGTVVVSFVVNKEGRVENVEATKKVRPDMDKEAIRVISSTVWIAGSKDGQRVNTELCLPIKFKLN